MVINYHGGFMCWNGLDLQEIISRNMLKQSGEYLKGTTNLGLNTKLGNWKFVLKCKIDTLKKTKKTGAQTKKNTLTKSIHRNTIKNARTHFRWFSEHPNFLLNCANFPSNLFQSAQRSSKVTRGDPRHYVELVLPVGLLHSGRHHCERRCGRTRQRSHLRGFCLCAWAGRGLDWHGWNGGTHQQELWI